MLSTGKVEVMINEYVDKNGNKRRNNRVSRRYLEYEPKQFKAGVF